MCPDCVRLFCVRQLFHIYHTHTHKTQWYTHAHPHTLLLMLKLASGLPALLLTSWKPGSSGCRVSNAASHSLCSHLFIPEENTWTLTVTYFSLQKLPKPKNQLLPLQSDTSVWSAWTRSDKQTIVWCRIQAVDLSQTFFHISVSTKFHFKLRKRDKCFSYVRIHKHASPKM